MTKEVNFDTPFNTCDNCQTPVSPPIVNLIAKSLGQNLLIQEDPTLSRKTRELLEAQYQNLLEVLESPEMSETLLTLEDFSPEEQTTIQALRDQKSQLEKEKREFDSEENKSIHKIEEKLNPRVVSELKEERNKKNRHDREVNKKIAAIDEEIEEEKEAAKRNALKDKQALDNTLKEASRKANSDSKTSNKPPSQQGLDKPKNQTKNPKKSGAPKGHEGYVPVYSVDMEKILELLKSRVAFDLPKVKELAGETPLEVIDLMPKEIPEGAKLSVGDLRIGLEPIIGTKILIYRQLVAKAKDPNNKRKIITCKGEFPSYIPKTHVYLPLFRAIALELRSVTQASITSIAQFINDIFGVPIKPPTVLKWLVNAGDDIAAAKDKFIEHIKNESKVGADETGIRENGETKWAFVSSSPKFTWITVHPKRDYNGIVSNGVLENLNAGTLVTHDAYSIYFDERLAHLVHGLCMTHVKRKVEEAIEFEEDYPQALTILKWLDKAFEARNQAIQEGRDTLDPKVLEELENEFDLTVRDALEKIPEKKQLYAPKTYHRVIRSMAKKVIKAQPHFFDFLDDPSGIPVPWIGCELSGSKNPPEIEELSKIAAQIDLQVCIAVQNKQPIPEEEKQRLKKAFMDQIYLIQKTFHTSQQLHYRAQPALLEETTLGYKVFRMFNEHRDESLLFIRNLLADATNNSAERALRPFKKALKNATTFRGEAKTYAALESYFSSANKQNLDHFQSSKELANSNVDYIFGGKTKAEESQPKITTKPHRKDESKEENDSESEPE